ncbi:hypothetical protein TNCV_1215241 [Trichonephila clavipes]|nr:hypothetical protein TNCV_1215241 [Trichonephila clavipes]
MENDKSLTTRMLAENFQCQSINGCLSPQKAWKSVENHWMVPHELSDNRADRVRIFTELLQQNKQAPFLKNLVTGDESWLIFKNVHRKEY